MVIFGLKITVLVILPVIFDKSDEMVDTLSILFGVFSLFGYVLNCKREYYRFCLFSFWKCGARGSQFTGPKKGSECHPFWTTKCPYFEFALRDRKKQVEKLRGRQTKLVRMNQGWPIRSLTFTNRKTRTLPRN